MFTAYKKRMQIVRNAYARVYVGSREPRYWTPYRLMPVGDARPGVAEESLDFILDSGFTDPTVENQHILERAEDLNANWFIPKDYLPWDAYDRNRLNREQVEFLDRKRAEYEGDHIQATIDSTVEAVEAWNDSRTNSRPIIPLQPDDRGTHVAHYNRLPEDLQTFGYFSLGGIAKAGADAQVRALREFRENVGYGPQVHALGVGTHSKVIKAIRDNPALVDSLDVSTPEQAVKNGRIPDKTFDYVPTGSFEIATGEESSTTRAVFMEAVYIHLCYVLSPFCEDDYFTGDENGRVQSGVVDW